jgi:hypothetical protein
MPDRSGAGRSGCLASLRSGQGLSGDDECRKKVLAYMSDERRQQTVADIKLLREAAKSNQLSKKDRRLLEMMEKAYAVELGLSPSPIAAVIETDPPTPVVESGSTEQE